MAELLVTMIRHAEREPGQDAITSVGKTQARALGTELCAQFPDSLPIGLCSGAVRTHQTLLALLEGMGLTESTIMPNPEPALQNKVSRAFDEEWTRLETSDPQAGVANYLAYRDRRPDPETLAPTEVAARVVRLIWRFVEPLDTPSVQSNRHVLMVTHSGIVELFLAALLNLDSIAEIGGILGYLERVHVAIETGDAVVGRDSASVRLDLRDHRWIVDLSLLRSLAQ